MTEEEIRPIAENYVEEYCHCPDGEYTDGSLVCAGIGTTLIVSRQLEKRIAELDMKRKAERKIFQGIVEKKNEQLTKAKEILQLFLKLKITPCASGNSINMLQFENVCNQVEQFLKEIEK